MVIYKHEMKLNYKSLFIWTLTVGILCAGCILLYTSLEESMEGIADSFANMGSMSAALGMDKMSLATMRGYYATEIAMMHGLGGAMFAAILGSSLLSKEEAGHTSEFLNVLPVGSCGVHGAVGDGLTYEGELEDLYSPDDGYVYKPYLKPLG